MGVRDKIRSSVAAGLRKAREVVADAPEASAGGEVDLRPEDVVLEPHHVIHQAGIGWDIAYVDVREPGEIPATGTLPAAHRIPLGELEVRRAEVPDDCTVVVVCDNGRRSLSGALALRAAGHDDAWSLRGGIDAWRREGGELERA